MPFTKAPDFAHRCSDDGRIHWRAPTLMVSSLLVGIAFAVGHHGFYRSLHNTELNTAGGTAFAFAVKASLVLAISTAYVQLFFRSIAKVGHGMAHIDSWFSGLGDITSLFAPGNWKQPLLAVVALTAWLLPISAIITPATLSVTFDHLPPFNESHFVPMPAFASLKIADFVLGGNELAYAKPSLEAARIKQAVDIGGSVLAVAPPALNASWEINITAPRLACEHANKTFLGAVKDNLAAVTIPMMEERWSSAQDANNMSSAFRAMMFSYISWTNVVEPNTSHPIDLPFFFENDELDSTLNASQKVAAALRYGPVSDVSYFSQVFVAALPRLLPSKPLFDIFNQTLDTPVAIAVRKAIDWAFVNATILRCEVVSSDYALRFSSHGPSQEQDLEVLQRADVVQSQNPSLDPYSVQSQTRSRFIKPECFQPRHEQANSSECDKDMNAVTQSSYRALLYLLSEALAGAGNEDGSSNTIWEKAWPSASLDFEGEYYIYSSRVGVTPLVDTIELAPLHAKESLLDWISGSDTTLTPDEAYSVSRTSFRTRRHLKDVLEEYFFNIKMSLASSPDLAYNISASNARENVTVTINQMGNIYTYYPEKLWLAYGLAIAITTLNVCIGLLAMFRTGASFTLNFSTIVRAAKNADVSVVTRETTLPGKDPLPEGWKRAMFTMRTPTVEMEGSGSKKGGYDSVEQSIEEGERGRGVEVEEAGDGNGYARRLSWDSREEEELQLAEQREREGNDHSHSDEPLEGATSVRSS